MSEMLANQYFLAMKYEQALPLFESVLDRDPINLKTKKKLIICYTQTGQLARAEALSVEVLQEDPYVIIDTDLQKEGCPCQDLATKLEHRLEGIPPGIMELNQLGILTLYWKPRTALQYFRHSMAMEPHQPCICKVVDLLTGILERPSGATKH